MKQPTESVGRTDEKLIITQQYMKKRIECFGFTEVADILRFLHVTVDKALEYSDYLYIRGKIDRCLRNHDDGGHYFIALRELASDLDCVLSQSKAVFRR